MINRSWRAAVVVVLGLAIPAVTGCASNGADPDSGVMHGIVSEPPLSVAGLSFADVSASDDPSRFDFTPAPGEVVAVYFGYTHCPDICPTAMSDLAAALTGLEPEQRARVSVAFVTVDPDRDTPDVLRDYLAHFFDSATLPGGAHALRDDDSAALAAAAERFGIQYEVVEAADGTIEVGHSALLSLVDDAGVISVQWPGGVAPDDIARDLATVLEGAS